MEKPTPYISINCWKCKAQNNTAVAITCRVCGAYLNTAEASAGPLSNGISDHPAFKGYLLVVGVVVLLSTGIIYFYRTKPPADEPAVTVSKEIVLPQKSWYNDSWWSYVSSSPSVRQILQKNAEANGKTPSLATARTFSISGKMARAVGSCFEQRCVDETKRRVAEQQQRLPPAYRWENSGVKRIGPDIELQASDKYEKLDFSEFGELELLVKVPNRMVKKATAINPYDESHRRVQIIEYFNGAEGKRFTDYFDALDNKVKSEVASMDAQQLESARVEQASLLGKDFDSYSDMQLRGLEKVNERVALAVTAKNRSGQSETFFFDAITGLVIKIDTPLHSVYLDDYRPRGQSVLPHTIYFRQPELGGFHSWIRVEIAEWKIGDPIADSVFVIPAGT